MPRTKTDFATQPVSFYRFVCEDENITSSYVGHTINFRARKSRHKSSCHNEKDKNYNLKIYQVMRANGGWGNWTMTEISSQLCSSERDAERIEQNLISELKSDMNSHRAYLTDEERKQYYQHNKEAINEYNKQYYQDTKEDKKQYYQDNKEAIHEKQKQYYQDNKKQICEKKKQYIQDHKEQQKQYDKQYYEDHKEAISEQKKQYRQKQKVKIELKLKQEVAEYEKLIQATEQKNQMKARCMAIFEERQTTNKVDDGINCLVE